MGNIKRQRMSILFLIYLGLIVFYYLSIAAWQIIPKHSSLNSKHLFYCNPCRLEILCNLAASSGSLCLM